VANFTNSALSPFGAIAAGTGSGPKKVVAREKNSNVSFELHIDRGTGRILKLVPGDKRGLGMVLEKGSGVRAWADNCTWVVDAIVN